MEPLLNEAPLLPEALLKYALEIGALELLPDGRELKSGRISPYFFNSGLFSSGKSIKILAQSYAKAIVRTGIVPDYIFGPAYKGIPLCVIIAEHYYDLTGVDVKFVFDRKEEKTHGEGGIIVGLPPGKKTFERAGVIIVDDVMTSGISSVKAYDMITKLDGIPLACVIGFDRQERGVDSDLSAVQMFTEKTGVQVESVLNLKLLASTLRDCFSPESIEGKIFKKIISYQSRYGIS